MDSTTEILSKKKGIKDPDPIEIFDKDLIKEMKTWLEQWDNIHSRFINAYRPCKNKGLNTVWTQQRNHYQKKGIENPDPIEIFDKDLIKEMKLG